MAKKGPPKGEGGRPLKPIDWDLAERMAKIQCTALEISSILKINQDTLADRCKKDHGDTFSEWYKKHSEDGKSSLRRAMFKAAIGGNVTMMIWLSKQYLGMRDRLDEIVDQRPLIIKTKSGAQITLGTTKKEDDNNGSNSSDDS
jgi:hypothetical protein